MRIPNTHPNLQAIKKMDTSRNPKLIQELEIEII
jgi:hypothetical protein